MSLGYFKFATIAGALLNLSNTGVNIKQGRAINSIEEKLSYIRDDISWIESNEINQLLSNQAALRENYEKDLAKLFSNKQLSLELDNAISALSTSESFNDPKVYDIMLAYINNINLLLTSTSETLTQMFDINETTLDKVLDLISEINSIKLRFNLDNADLQLKISDNSRLIIKLSEQQLAYQLSTLQNFNNLRDDLEKINSQVDKKMADFGVLSTNTTGVLLADGTFKLADTLSLVEGDIFDITFSESSHTSVNSKGHVYMFNGVGVNSNIPYITLYSNEKGNQTGQRLVSSSSSCNILNVTSSTLIKKFSQHDHTGVSLLLNKPYKLLVSNVNPQRDLFIFLKGAGLSAFADDGLSVQFIPALTKYSEITATLSGELYDHRYKPAAIHNVSWGIPGSYKIPSSTAHVKIGSIFTASLIQKSDELIVIKIKVSSNYPSVLSSGSISGGVVSGAGFPSGSTWAITKGGFFSMPSVSEILAGGSFVINLPVNHLSFSGVEAAQ